jgi:uncharacterized protein
MSGGAAGDWGAVLLDFRERKDAYFRSGRGPVETQTFTGLSYFPPDPAWNLTLELELERVPSRTVSLATTVPGEVQTFVSWGRVQLPYGEHLTLYAREGQDAPRTLFVPFRDATSGLSTYGAGRYLDALIEGDTVLLDFNTAYHPYCAYSDAWVCPLPPGENWLNVPVEAGEKLPV